MSFAIIWCNIAYTYLHFIVNILYTWLFHSYWCYFFLPSITSTVAFPGHFNNHCASCPTKLCVPHFLVVLTVVMFLFFFFMQCTYLFSCISHTCVYIPLKPLPIYVLSFRHDMQWIDRQGRLMITFYVTYVYISHIFSVSFPVPPPCVPLAAALFIFYFWDLRSYASRAPH